MTTRRVPGPWGSLIAIVGAIMLDLRAIAQGTVTFDSSPMFDGTDYFESGVWFHVVTPGAGPHDDMGIGGPITGPSNVPYNNTPYMIFFRAYSTDNYVTLSLANGSAFGLTSVQLADPNSPSSTMLPITFLGLGANGLTVTNIFTTPGNGADHLLTCQFTSNFAFGLISVQIPSSRWAMDNLVFTIPEPGALALVIVGFLALRFGPRLTSRHSSSPPPQTSPRRRER